MSGAVLAFPRRSPGSVMMTTSTLSRILHSWVIQRFLLGIASCSSNERVTSPHPSKTSSGVGFTIAPGWLAPWWPTPGREKHTTFPIRLMEMLPPGSFNVSPFCKDYRLNVGGKSTQIHSYTYISFANPA